MLNKLDIPVTFNWYFKGVIILRLTIEYSTLLRL